MLHLRPTFCVYWESLVRCRTLAAAEIVFEPFDLVHSFMQDRDDADVAVRERTPVNKMSFISKVIAADTKIGRDAIPPASIWSKVLNKSVM